MLIEGREYVLRRPPIASRCHQLLLGLPNRSDTRNIAIMCSCDGPRQRQPQPAQRLPRTHATGQHITRTGPNTYYARLRTIRTSRRGKAGFYLASVLDCAGRKVIGWAMGDHYRTPLITSAITMAARNIGLPDGAVFHSDRGSITRRPSSPPSWKAGDPPVRWPTGSCLIMLSRNRSMPRESRARPSHRVSHDQESTRGHCRYIELTVRTGIARFDVVRPWVASISWRSGSSSSGSNRDDGGDQHSEGGLARRGHCF